eukprot:TRINITY_DN44184_c0_g1_i1.p1 TRINITY_DN44184_c0_g1~~TRINITY_DN44184_c0_g1_i1.p1  ORF type:complete len:107 (-),score=0.31 TRINITY_DN44184_c0_g1_i1:30-350(-)
MTLILTFGLVGLRHLNNSTWHTDVCTLPRGLVSAICMASVSAVNVSAPVYAIRSTLYACLGIAFHLVVGLGGMVQIPCLLSCVICSSVAVLSVWVANKEAFKVKKD